MKTQTISPKGIESTVKFMGEENTSEKEKELQTLLAKLHDKQKRQAEEIATRIKEVETELATLKK